MISQKQQIILDHLKTNKQMTLDDAIDLVGQNIHTNHSKYVGLTMSRMVNRNLIRRIKPGVFELYDSRENIEQGTLL